MFKIFFMRSILFFVFIIFASSLFAQDSTFNKNADSSALIIHKDPRVDLLIKKQADINEMISRETKRMAKGFRVLVINTNKRDQAVDAKAKVYTYFPELKPYLIYQSPYFRLKVGDFLDRKDAEDYQKKLSKYFPNGVFVVNDIVEVTPEQEREAGNSNP